MHTLHWCRDTFLWQPKLNCNKILNKNNKISRTPSANNSNKSFKHARNQNEWRTFNAWNATATVALIISDNEFFQDSSMLSCCPMRGGVSCALSNAQRAHASRPMRSGVSCSLSNAQRLMPSDRGLNCRRPVRAPCPMRTQSPPMSWRGSAGRCYAGLCYSPLFPLQARGHLPRGAWGRWTPVACRLSWPRVGRGTWAHWSSLIGASPPAVWAWGAAGASPAPQNWAWTGSTTRANCKLQKTWSERQGTSRFYPLTPKGNQSKISQQS